MTSGSVRFGEFVLDPAERRLRRGGAAVELNARYFDALALLVREQGKLVSKDRFMDEVWRGVPVTDEALTQCIRTLRRLLGDDAAHPRFIETVPKHGYRFIAAVESDAAGPAASRSAFSWPQFLLLGGAGTLGGALAGMAGGLLYGFAGATQPAGVGAASVLLVLLCLSILVALIGAAGVALGIALAWVARGPRSPWLVAGGALGGLMVGACVKLLGLDAFQLLLGRSPGDVTGAAEGALLGGAIGLGAWLASRGTQRPPLARAAGYAAVAGAIAGMIIPLAGGRMWAGSLVLLARQFPESQLQADELGALFGDRGFGRFSEVMTGGLEGLLFGGLVVAAMILARRRFGANAA